MTEYFNNGFEEGDFSEWTTTETSGGTIAVETNNPYEGTYNSKAAISSGSYARSIKDYTTGTTRYGRIYVKFSGSLPSSSGDWIMLFAHKVNGGANDCSGVIIKHDGTSAKFCLFNREGAAGWTYTYASSPAPEVDTWYCLEVYHKNGSGDGENTLWIDGVEKATVTDADNDAYSPGRIVVGVYANPATTFTVYSDSVIVADAYIGTGGTAYTKNLTETITITGTITEDFTKEVTESMTLTDVIAQDFGKVLTETLTITDTLSRDTVKVLTEAMTITGVIEAAIGEYFTLNLTETMTITDSLHKILYDLSVFDPVTVVQVILYSNWNETTVGRPTIRSFVKREVEQGIIKRWNYLLNGDLIGISETGFEKTPHSAGYDYTTTVIKVKLNVGTAKGRTHLFAVFDELRRCLHLKRGAPTSAYTSWRPLIVTNRTIHYDKYKKLWKMDVFVELREKCYALA